MVHTSVNQPPRNSLKTLKAWGAKANVWLFMNQFMDASSVTESRFLMSVRTETDAQGRVAATAQR